MIQFDSNGPPEIPPRIPNKSNLPPARPYKPQKFRTKPITAPIKITEQNPLIEDILKSRVASDSRLICKKTEADYRDVQKLTTPKDLHSSEKTIKIACSSCQNPIKLKIMNNDTVVFVNCSMAEKKEKEKQKDIVWKRLFRCFLN